MESEPHEGGRMLEHLGTPMLVQVNLAVSGMDRLVGEVRGALQRRQHEEVGAGQAAICTLYSELNGTITALLLSSELALETAGLPAAAAEKLQSVHELVKKLRRQLESADPPEGPEPLCRTVALPEAMPVERIIAI